MNALIVTALPKALMAIAAKLLTDKFLVKVFTNLVVYGLEKLASNTATKIDDKLVADIKAQLNG